jgi:hypothetical protein
LKPRLTRRFLELHGLFLLLMVPFGYHWLPQEALLRTATGVLFGFGLVTYLWLPTADWNRDGETGWPRAGQIYAAAVVLVLLLVPSLAAWGERFAALSLSCLALCGAATLLALAIANVGLGAMLLARLILRLKARTAA